MSASSASVKPRVGSSDPVPRHHKAGWRVKPHRRRGQDRRASEHGPGASSERDAKNRQRHHCEAHPGGTLERLRALGEAGRPSSTSPITRTKHSSASAAVAAGRQRDRAHERDPERPGEHDVHERLQRHPL